MQTTRFFLLASVAVLTACSGGRGPGEIGSHDDIIIRNAGDPPLTKTADTMGPMMPEVAAEDGVPKKPEMADAAPEAEMVESKAEDAAVADAEEEAAIKPVKDVVSTESTSAEALNEEPQEDHEFTAEKTDVIEKDMLAEGEAVEQPVTGEMGTTKMRVPPSDQIMDGTVMKGAAPEVKPQPEAEVIKEEMEQAITPVAEPATAPTATQAPAKQIQPAQQVVPQSAERAIEAQKPAPPAELVQPAKGLPKAPYWPYGQEPAAPIEAEPALNDTATLPTLSSDTIMSVQKALKTKGYYFGAADGTLGAETLNALVLYQNAHGLDGAGALNNATLKKLGLPAIGQ